MNLKILVVYEINPFREKKFRKTIFDHLYCFKRYPPKNISFHYLNTYFGIPKFLKKANYDGIILHERFVRWCRSPSFKIWFEKIKPLKELNIPKVAIPQDEYDKTDNRCLLFKTLGVKTVFTCAVNKKDWPKLYPKAKSGVKTFIPVHPGYVDQNTLKKIPNIVKNNYQRTIDIGYRARKCAFWYGKHAQKKYQIGQKIKKYCQKKHPYIKLDISSRPEDVFNGNDWLKFLASCKAVLGCESGASLLNKDGQIRTCTEAYLSKNPKANFPQVEKKCFKNKDNQLTYFALSPRHFEAAMTKTCQILLEGDYAGVLKPDIHYIKLSFDYSNIEKVISKFLNQKYREKIVNQAYQDLIVSGKYTYKTFVNLVTDHFKKLEKKPLLFSPKAVIMYWLVGIFIQLNYFYQLKFRQMEILKERFKRWKKNLWGKK